MKIYIIRHAESEANRLKQHQGWKINTGLSEEGKRQAKKLANRLKDEKIEAIYSSDSKRTVETAKEIAKLHKLKVIKDKRLREFRSGDIKIGCGKWSKYKTKESERLNIERHEVKAPNGESESDHIKRIRAFLEDFEKKKYDGTVVIVAHGMTNRMFFGAARILDWKEVWEKISDQKNTCVNELTYDRENKQWEIKRVNCIQHLENNGLGGWQFWVDLYDSYVIKTPKSRDEIKEEVEGFLRWKNKLEELDERTDKMIFDIKNATKIIKESKIPKRYLADLEFLEDGRIKQKKVMPLDKVLKKLNKKERLELIDKIVNFLLEIWRYGIHEYTYKFFSNLGINKEKIVFIDPFEITSNKRKVLKQIKKQKWAKPEKYQKHLSADEIDYLMKKLNKTFTEKKLNKYWKTKWRK